MSDLISRQAAIDAIEFGITYAKAINKETGEIKELFKQSNDELRNAVERIVDIPTADAVEVVRCKDCRYWQDNNGGYPHEECRWGHNETPDADDYCSYGERKEQ